MLERQGDEAHSLFVSAFEKNLNALSSSFDVCIIDTNPSPDIRSNLGLLVCTHLIAPIQLNKEAIDGISRIVDRVNEIAEYNSNFPNAFLGMLPNAIESNKFQQKNAIDLTQNYGAMLICEKSYGFAAAKNDKGQLVPVIEDGNYKLVDREAPLGIKRRTCIAESQAFGTPIWDSPNSADAWSELRKVFFTIYENMHITRLNSASEEQLSILNECASLYGINSFKKIIRQFLMTGNARLLPRLSLEKANALRDLKKSISLDFLANFTPSIKLQKDLTMDIQDTSYRQIGVLFDGQFKYKLSPQQRVVLAGLTSMSLKGYSGSGNPVIKASDEEIVNHLELISLGRFKHLKRCLIEAGAIELSLIDEQKQTIFINGSSLIGNSLQVVSFGYITKDLTHYSGDALILSILLQTAAKNAASNGGFFWDSFASRDIENTLNISARGKRNILKKLKEGNIIRSCFYFPINTHWEVSIPYSFDKELGKNYIKANKCGLSVKILKEDHRSCTKCDSYKGILHYSNSAKCFLLRDCFNEDLIAYVESGDVIDMTLNSKHYLARIYKTDELWFFPSLEPIAVDNIQLDAEAIVYKKKSNSRVLNKKKKLSVSVLKAMLNKSKKAEELALCIFTVFMR